MAVNISERQESVNLKQKDVKFLVGPAAGVHGCEAWDRVLSDISYTLTPPVHSEKELRVLSKAPISLADTQNCIVWEHPIHTNFDATVLAEALVRPCESLCNEPTQPQKGGIQSCPVDRPKGG